MFDVDTTNLARPAAEWARLLAQPGWTEEDLEDFVRAIRREALIAFGGWTVSLVMREVPRLPETSMSRPPRPGR